MAYYQIMYWKDIPAQVKANDEDGLVKGLLPDRFSEAIDAAAMVEGSSDTEQYLEGWHWSPKQERAGTAQQVLDAVVAELDEAYPGQRLAVMIRERKTKSG